jgi:hypothetical protein
MSRVRWVSVLALSGLAALLLASTAVGKATSVRSTVTIVSGEGAKFSGKVAAAKRKCRANRTVRLYTEGASAYAEAGSARPGDVLVDVAKTDATGAWRMDGNFYAGVYYAQVLALLVMIDGDPYRCAPDLSLRMRY